MTTAAGTRVRSGTATPTIAAHASGTRTRSGTAVGIVGVTATATGTRVRGGWAFPLVVSSTVGPGTPPGRRWTFYDPLTAELYEWETNANDGGSPDRKRTLTTQSTLAIDGKPLVFEGREPIWQITVKGTILSAAHYHAMVAWFSKRHIVLLTDDLGRQMQVIPESFTPVRAWKARHPFRHTYTAVLRLIGYGTAPILQPGPSLVLA